MNNPYQGSNSGGAFQSSAAGLQATSYAQLSLSNSKGWVRFLSVLGFISFAFMVVAAIGMITLMGSIGGMGIGGMGIFSFLLMAVMSVVTFMLSLRLSKFSSAIGRMQLTRQPVELEIAMVEQMKFWRLLGILTLIWLVMVLLALIAGLTA